MNNEPIAWMCKDDDVITDKFKKSGKGGDCSDYNIPLYTHPAKTLTDGEIVRISETCDLNHVLGLIDFARAILRKAQEK